MFTDARCVVRRVNASSPSRREAHSSVIAEHQPTGSHRYPRPRGSSVPDSSATTTVKEMAEQKMFRRLADYFGGRHTLFVVFFALSGFALAWFGKLTSSYVALCSALQTAVLAHSAKEDYFDAKKRAAGKQGDDGA